MNTLLPIGSHLHLTQGLDQPFTIPYNEGGQPAMPAVPHPRNDFPSEYLIGTSFFARQAGRYRFTTGAQINERGLLVVGLENQNDGKTYTAEGTNTVNLSIELYLNPDESVRRVLAFYGETDATIKVGGTNFFQVTYLGL